MGTPGRAAEQAANARARAANARATPPAGGRARAGLAADGAAGAAGALSGALPDAGEGVKTLPQAGDMTGALFQVAGVLCLLLALIFVGFWVLKRFGKRMGLGVFRHRRPAHRGHHEPWAQEEHRRGPLLE